MRLLAGHLAALFTIFVWGLTFISTRILLNNLTPVEILFIRFLLGWIALWIFCPSLLAWQGRRTEFGFALAGLSGVTIYFLLENIALEYTYAANVGVIVSTAPFFTALVDWLFFSGKRPGPAFCAGFALAIAGISLMAFADGELNISPAGDLLALLAAIAWAFYSCITRGLSSLDLGSLKITRRIFFYGLVFMLPALTWSGLEARPEILLAPAVYANLLFLGIGASAICFATWTFCLARLGTARASAYIYLVPVVTVLAAAIFLQEQIGWLSLLGMSLVIPGLIISETKFGSELKPCRLPGSVSRQCRPDRL